MPEIALTRKIFHVARTIATAIITFHCIHPNKKSCMPCGKKIFCQTVNFVKSKLIQSNSHLSKRKAPQSKPFNAQSKLATRSIIAMLDSGSNSTNIDKDFAKEMGMAIGPQKNAESLWSTKLLT